MTEKLFTVGTIVNTHGIRGELKVVAHTDFPEERFQKKSKLFMHHADTQQTIPVEVESSRSQKNMFVIKFSGFNNINEVEKYKGWLLKVSESDREALDEDEYYYSDIIGCQVVTDEGEELGVIHEILSPGANDVWVVKRKKGGDVLLPVIDEVILDINITDKVIRVHIMEGLL
ncbi:ribosome maturation factor RimM [Paenibacillus selenitireducens]|jgi:16S rRNA processing protein RimM|uniref:Ribosome maturation factor RimM n=1 Tax=Paenibacillus selenitireducens TaxID=1324314 RepID=A0A1T2XCJ8_9BACL|nr:ribosome maturation factor RimM [Paenibacillus selenitireducens]OPA77555.1 ribosome maturation factor RimM [Paenibacillus selenitireducens]